MNRLSICIVMSIGLFFWGISSVSHAQMKSVKESCISSFRMPLPPPGFKPKLEDLNGDGKPEAIYSMTGDSVPILWIDDDRDMKWTDIEGDMTAYMAATVIWLLIGLIAIMTEKPICRL